MAIYSFRAECQADVKRFHQECLKVGLITALQAKPDDQFPDVEVELQTDASLEALRNVMRRVVDGHVMLQTLRECPLAENSLERDYDLS
ncbi:hypothetical protein [Crenobacter cavernae]|uniref:Uncharacterized protein n=1 Tax=Crenobacter cavernae TaxID=2290923 RepID=A0A345Y3M4_9NEIS|nr:hypothetical protein [Crenobacter cavernae]AXK38526.1 hypothetical protein DWG20_03285 [Crenobacter cavernae]